ncbi:MAG TPA: rRNA maturation RNase YbeY [Kiritimatiellia bacterium]|nr:rRNA maturation RNase YbeY [Kiritimatiellia bacterium]
MEISVTNLQRRHRINRTAVLHLARYMMNKASRMDRSRIWAAISIVLVDHEKITGLNEQILKHKGTTDVITFAYPPTPGHQDAWQGEIVVNMEEAVEQGARRRGGANRELALYIAHGCQHLGGADDNTRQKRAAMNRRQNRWLAGAANTGISFVFFK